MSVAEEFKMHEGKPPESSPNQHEKVTAYTLDGLEVLSTSPQAYAKLAMKGGQATYFLKYGGTGHFINPLDPMFRSDSLSWNDDNRGRKPFHFVKIDKDIFDKYMKFLKTRNGARLAECERMMIDR